MFETIGTFGQSSDIFKITQPNGATAQRVVFVIGSPSSSVAVELTPDGKIPITGSFSATTTARATAFAPSYVEGTDSPISQDLNGNLRTQAVVTIPPGATFSSIQSAGSPASPWYFFLVNSAGVSASQAGPWTVGRNWGLTSGGDSVLVHLDAPITIGQTPVTQVTNPWVVSQSSANSSVLAHLDAPISISSISVSNFPTNQNVTITGQPISVVTQSVGTVLVQQGTVPWTVSQTSVSSSILAHLDAPLSIGSISVNNFPSNQNVTVTNSVGVWAQQAGAWSTGRTWNTTSAADSILAHIDNFPATQPVSGSLGRTWTLSDPSDIVKVNQGTSPWVVTQGSVGTVLVTQGTSPWTVSQTTSVGVFAQQAGPWTSDVTDRSARLLGVLTNITQSVGVSALQAGTWTVNQGTSPWVVNQTTSVGHFAQQAGAWSVDVTDRSARLLGVVTNITQSVGVSATIVGQPISIVTVDPVNPTTQRQAVVSQTSAAVVFPYAVPTNSEDSGNVFLTAKSTNVQLLAALPNLRHYITSVSATASAGGMPFATVVVFRDGSADKIVMTLSSSGDSWAAQSFNTPIRGSLNTAWNATLNQASSVMVSAQGFFAP